MPPCRRAILSCLFVAGTRAFQHTVLRRNSLSPRRLLLRTRPLAVEGGAADWARAAECAENAALCSVAETQSLLAALEVELADGGAEAEDEAFLSMPGFSQGKKAEVVTKLFQRVMFSGGVAELITDLKRGVGGAGDAVAVRKRRPKRVLVKVGLCACVLAMGGLRPLAVFCSAAVGVDAIRLAWGRDAVLTSPRRR